MTRIGEYDPTEQALRYAEIRAGARYFADIAQALRSSLTWDTERMGTELYPVVMRALDGIEDTREACERVAEALEDRADTLITELNAHRERVQIGVGIPQELYDELDRRRAINTTRCEVPTTADLIVELLKEYVDQHRDEINRFEEQHSEHREIR